MRISLCPTSRAALLAISAVGMISVSSAAQDDVATLVIVTPAPLIAKVKSIKPPAGAQQKGMIGSGQTMLHTTSTTSDLDSYWSERVDIDGDGNVDDSDWLWDDEARVLYTYDDNSFRCGKGGTGNGQMLVAVYGDGNARGRPEGSGWWVASLDEGECGAKTQSMYGCRFNSQGTRTSCGVAMLDDTNDDIVIASAKMKVAKP